MFGKTTIDVGGITGLCGHPGPCDNFSDFVDNTTEWILHDWLVSNLRFGVDLANSLKADAAGSFIDVRRISHYMIPWYGSTLLVNEFDVIIILRITIGSIFITLQTPAVQETD